MAIDDTNAPPHPVSRADAHRARWMVMLSRAPEQHVDDITQEVLCALAFRRDPITVLEGFTPAQARVMFLRGVVERQVANHARRQARLQLGDTLSMDGVVEEHAPSAEELMLDLAELGTIRRALEKLAEIEPELHEVLERVAAGETIAALAARLHVPAGTAWSRLRRARIAVRGLIQKEAPREATGMRTAPAEEMDTPAPAERGSSPLAGEHRSTMGA